MSNLGPTTVFGDLKVTGKIMADTIQGTETNSFDGLLDRDLIIKKKSPVSIILNGTDAVEGKGPQIIFGDTNKQFVRIRENHFDSIRAPFGLHIERDSSNQQLTNKAYLQVEGDIFAQNQYKVYHEGNKPTPAAIGAARALIATNGYEGISLNDGTDGTWVRTTKLGFIPYQSGGYSSIGTQSWPFKSVYTQDVFSTNLITTVLSVADKAVIANKRSGNNAEDANIILREHKNVGSSITTSDFAPSIGFIWSEKKSGVIAMNSDGGFHFRQSPFHYKDDYADVNVKDIYLYKKEYVENEGTECAVYFERYTNNTGYIKHRINEGKISMTFCVSEKVNEVDHFTWGAEPGAVYGRGEYKEAMRLTTAGTLTAKKIYNSGSNDYAEFFEKEDQTETFEPGDVVVWNQTGITKSTIAEDTRAIGVYSDTFGHIVGGETGAVLEDNYEKYVPIGLTGRVNVKLTGAIAVGDLICTSEIPGVAMKSTTKTTGTIIGKCLETKTSEGVQRVAMLIFNG